MYHGGLIPWNIYNGIILIMVHGHSNSTSTSLYHSTPTAHLLIQNILHAAIFAHGHFTSNNFEM